MLDLYVADEDDRDDDSPEVPAEESRMHEGMPIRGWHYGEPIPNLDQIPKERWRAVLKPLRHGTRLMARAHTQSDVIAAG
jgi:hypothetical protein